MNRTQDESITAATTVLLLLTCSVLLAPVLSFRMGMDQANYAYMAWMWLEGHWPYVGTWDLQFPGGWVLHALEIAVFGKSVWLFRVFDLLFQLASAWLIFRITRRAAGVPAAFVAAALFCLIYQGYGPWNTGQREGFGLLFILAGFWLYLTHERRPAWLTAAGIGVLLGFAVTIKPTLLALSALYAPLLLDLRARHWRIVLVAVVTLLLPSALFVLAYMEQGALQAMYDACIGFTTQVYVPHSNAGDSLLQRWLDKAMQLGTTAKLLSVTYLPFLFIGEQRRLRLMLYCGYLGSIFAVLAQGTFAGYHYLPGLGIGAILIGSIFHIVTAPLLQGRMLQLAQQRVSLQALAAVVAIVLAFVHYHNPVAIQRTLNGTFLDAPFPDEYRNSTVFDFTESWDTAEYIREHTRADDTILVWGNDPLVYYLAERHGASRFQNTLPLVVYAPGGVLTPMQLDWRQEYLASISERRPAMVAVVRDDNWWWAPKQQTSWQLLDEFPEFKTLLFEQYTEEHRIGRFVIFRRR
jgi:hypothetical protein